MTQILENRITTELVFDPLDTTYVLGRETLIVTAQSGMPLWCKHLFALMSRNARNAALFFLPSSSTDHRSRRAGQILMSRQQVTLLEQEVWQL